MFAAVVVLVLVVVVVVVAMAAVSAAVAVTGPAWKGGMAGPRPLLALSIMAARLSRAGQGTVCSLIRLSIVSCGTRSPFHYCQCYCYC